MKKVFTVGVLAVVLFLGGCCTTFPLHSNEEFEQMEADHQAELAAAKFEADYFREIIKILYKEMAVISMLNSLHDYSVE